MDNIININNINETAGQSIFGQANRHEIIGICYVPMQKWEQLYDEDTGFSAGTVFPALNLPFLGGGK